MTPKIAYVHLNSRVPLYLRFNIRATARKFPKTQIVLIHNSNSRIYFNSNIEQFKYTQSEDSESIRSFLSHPRDFRGNFWFSAIQRFDALRQYMALTSGPILHLESDVIISSDFPLVQFGLLQDKLAFPVVAQNRGVASSLFLSDATKANQLVELSIELSKLKSSITDMEILAEFRKAYPENSLSLNFGPRAKGAYVAEFPFDDRAESLQRFGGAFDGNDIGVFLFGSDPRNARAISYLGRKVPGNYALIDKWEISYDENRRFLNVGFSGNAIPVFSIHATCKNLLLFNRYSQDLMIKRFLWMSKRSQAEKRYFRLFILLGVNKVLKFFK